MLKKSVLAILMAFPALALAQTTQELKAELDALKAHVKRLEAMIEKSAAAKPAEKNEPQEVVEVSEFNRIKIKVEGMEDAAEANGFKGMKVSGYLDPSYIYNKKREDFELRVFEQ